MLRDIFVSGSIANEIYEENKKLVDDQNPFKSIFSFLFRKFVALGLASITTFLVLLLFAGLVNEDMFSNSYCDSRCSKVLVFSGAMIFMPYVLGFLLLLFTYLNEITIQKIFKDTRYRGLMIPIFISVAIACVNFSSLVPEYLHMVNSINDGQNITQYIDKMEIRMSDFLKVRVPDSSAN